MTVLEFRNELVKRLNNNLDRYHGGTCNGRKFPYAETFAVDDVYEVIDRVYDGIPEDEGGDKSDYSRREFKL